MKLSKLQQYYYKQYKDIKEYQKYMNYILPTPVNILKFNKTSTKAFHGCSSRTKVSKVLMEQYGKVLVEYTPKHDRNINPKENIHFCSVLINIHNVPCVLSTVINDSTQVLFCNENEFFNTSSITCKSIYFNPYNQYGIEFLNFTQEEYKEIQNMNFINPTEEQRFQYNLVLNFDLLKTAYDIVTECSNNTFLQNVSFSKIAAVLNNNNISKG